MSVTFDPFCYLSLPLPMKKERQIDVFFISANPASRIVQYKLTVPKLGYVDDLCQVFIRITLIPLLTTDGFDDSIFMLSNCLIQA